MGKYRHFIQNLRWMMVSFYLPAEQKQKKPSSWKQSHRIQKPKKLRVKLIIFISSGSEGRVSQFHQSAAAAEWRCVVCLWNQRFQPLLSDLQGKHAKPTAPRRQNQHWKICMRQHAFLLPHTHTHTHFYYEVLWWFWVCEVKRWMWMDDAHV